jgi:hypothetical protein
VNARPCSECSSPADVLAGRCEALTALHGADSPDALSHILEAVFHYDCALDILLDRIPAGYVELRTRILERPPAV